MRRATTILLFGLGACAGDKGGGGGGGGGTDTGDGPALCDRAVDADCDGAADADDCDPDDAYVYPGATEIPYDGRDNDCAGDGDLTDVDGDGFAGPIGVGPDCNDANPAVYPGAPEACYDGIDQDCDGAPAVGEDESRDCDGDGHIGIGADATDCNDEDPAVNPDAAERWYDGVDQDCNARSDWDADGDGDELAGHDEGLDCDDADASTSSLEKERLDGADRDCDGEVDALGAFDAAPAWVANTTSLDGWFGKQLAVLDDYTGDGVREVVAGGPLSDSDGSICAHDGALYPACGGWLSVLDPAGAEGPPPDVALTRVIGTSGASVEEAGDWLGYDLAYLGDVDGDGWGELAVGAPLADGFAGAVYIVDGAALAGGGTPAIASARVASVRSSAGFFGFDVAALPDLDGDGVAELVAGPSDGHIGRYQSGVDLFLAVHGSRGLGGGTRRDADAAFLLDGSSAGGETIGTPDLDGDGLPELITAVNTLGSGGVVVVDGAALVAGGSATPGDFVRLLGEGADEAGLQLGFIPDADGDGFGTLVVSRPGAEGAGFAAGDVVGVSGDALGATADLADVAAFRVVGEVANGRFSVAGEAHADVNADGVPDLLLSSLGGTVLGSIVSEAVLMDGAALAAGGTFAASDAVARFPSRLADDQLGFSALLEDVDADGDADVTIAAPFNNNVGSVSFFASGFAD